MNYIQKGFQAQIDWWRYIVVLSMVFLGVGLLSVPHSIALGTIEDFDLSRAKDLEYLFSLFDLNLNLLFMILPFLGGLAALFIGVKYIHKQTIVDLTTSRKKIDWNRIRFSFTIWGIAVALFVGLQYLSMPDMFVYNFKLKPFLVLLGLSVILIPIQTSFEEYVFRGYLMQSLGVLAKNKWFPLLFTSLTFGLLHFSNPEVDKLGYGLLVYYIVTGLFLGVLTLMDEGMELSLGFHMANNLITALLVTADWTAFQTHSIFKDLSEPTLLTAILPPFVIYIIVLFVFSKKYKWNNWKEKLIGKIVTPQKIEVSEDEFIA